MVSSKQQAEKQLLGFAFIFPFLFEFVLVCCICLGPMKGRGKEVLLLTHYNILCCVGSLSLNVENGGKKPGSATSASLGSPTACDMHVHVFGEG